MKKRFSILVLFFVCITAVFSKSSLPHYVVTKCAEETYTLHLAGETNDRLILTGDITSSGFGNEMYYMDKSSDSLRLLKDINPGTNGSHPYGFTQLDSLIFFTTNPLDDGTRKIWRTNGTEAGTFGLAVPSDYPNEMINNIVTCGNKVYYNGGSIWQNMFFSTEGTDASSFAITLEKSSMPNVLFSHKGLVYFTKTDTFGTELWQTDGVNKHMLKDLWPNNTYLGNGIFNSSSPGLLTDLEDGRFVFQATVPDQTQSFSRQQLFVSDGTKDGTVQVSNFTGRLYPYINILAAADGKAYFICTDGSFRDEAIYCYDGTTVNKLIELDDAIYLTKQGYAQTIYKGKFYFALTNINGTTPSGNFFELWESDGSVAGTKKVIADMGAEINAFREYNGELIAFGGGIYAFNGDSTSFRLLTNYAPADYPAERSIVFNNSLYYSHTASKTIYKISEGEYKIDAPDTLYIRRKAREYFKAKFFPENAANPYLSYLSTNTSIVGYSYGQIVGNSVGEADLKVIAQQDDSIYKYVHVIVEEGDKASITKLAIDGQVGATYIYDEVYSTAKHIQVFMPQGTDLSNLHVSNVELSHFATASVALDTITDFSNPVTITVTSGNNSKSCDWVIEVLVKPDLSEYVPREMNFSPASCTYVGEVGTCPTSWTEQGLNFSLSPTKGNTTPYFDVYQQSVNLHPAQLNINSDSIDSEIGFVELCFYENCADDCSYLYGELGAKQVGKKLFKSFRKIYYQADFLSNPVKNLHVVSSEGGVSKLVVWTKPSPTNQNQKPIANAGNDTIVNEGTIITLDGNASTDADNDSLKYEWYTTAGVKILNAHTATPSVVLPMVQADSVISLVLVVSDFYQNSLSDTLNISIKNVINTAPVITRAPGKKAFVGATVHLLVEATDAENNVLTYSWTSKDGITISNSDSTTASFIATSVGSFEFTIRVSDGELYDEVPVTVLIKENTQAPVAVITDYSLNEGGTIELDASSSYDPEGMTDLIYNWEIISEEFSLPNQKTSKINFTAPAVDRERSLLVVLTVSDGLLVSEEKEFHINIHNVLPAIKVQSVSHKASPVEMQNVQLMFLNLDNNTGKWNGNMLEPLTGTSTYGLSAGKWMVVAYPSFPAAFDFIPTYAPASPVWQAAKQFDLGELSVDSTNISLLPKEIFTGNGSISGSVLQMLVGENSMTLSDVELVLFEMPSSNPIALINADNLGSFKFEGLPAGEYYLQVNIPGMDCSEGVKVELSTAINSIQDIVFLLNESKASVSVVSTDLNQNILRTPVVYPNPASDILNITEVNASKYLVYGLDGQLLLSCNTSPIDVSSLSEGMYILKLSGVDGIFSTEFIVKR